MSDALKKFIETNREAFEQEEPSPELWNKLEHKLEKANNVPLLSIKSGLWSVLIAASLLVAVSVLTFRNRQVSEEGGNAVASKQIPEGSSATAPDTQNNHAGQPAQTIQTGGDSLYSQELYHFTQIINIKFREIEKIKSAHPELYQRFSADIQKLDSNYQQLKQQLPGEANQEMVLKAMLQNLTLQVELINRQLGIIEELKKESHAKAATTSI
jgi:hypothetical protein